LKEATAVGEMSRGILPPEFSDLEPFVERWAVATMAARHRRRLASKPEERKAFYDAMAPRLPAVAAYLDQWPLHDLPPAGRALLQLALALTEVSLTQEVYDARTEALHARSSRLLRIAREMDGL
jgi:hypothetical protein